MTMSVRWLIAAVAMTMAAPAIATSRAMPPEAITVSVAKQLYPTSPISDEGWQTLIHIVRSQAESAQRQPDSLKAERHDNRQG
jgi:hypothetical protein